MEIALFFGSFNPIHMGHMIIAQTILNQSDIDEVWFVVSPQNPFKKNKSLLHEFDRYDMVQSAVYENPKFRVIDVEFRMPKPSYTIDTLVVLQEKHPTKNFRLIIGEDNLVSFHRWKNFRVILDEYGLLVYPRPNTIEKSPLLHDNISMIEAPLLDISATFIRSTLRAGKSIQYLVPEPVERSIRVNGFYL